MFLSSGREGIDNVLSGGKPGAKYSTVNQTSVAWGKLIALNMTMVTVVTS